MGSAVPPIITNLYRAHFEELAIASAVVRPSIWYSYVDETFIKINRGKLSSSYQQH